MFYDSERTYTYKDVALQISLYVLHIRKMGLLYVTLLVQVTLTCRILKDIFMHKGLPIPMFVLDCDFGRRERIMGAFNCLRASESVEC